jgi:hypothetical protein
MLDRMTISAITYAPPVRHGTRPPRRDYALLDAAAELYEQGQHAESLAKVFAHLFPDAKLGDLATEPFAFTQGSSRVTVRVEGGELVATVPLVKLPTGGAAIAALRFVLTKLSANGQLHQPRLRGDDIYLEFRDKVSRLHPAKVLEMLRHMPSHADANDDWLIGQFGAVPLERAEVGTLGDDEVARCEAIWRQHWGDVEALLAECQRKRSLFFLNELTAYALHRVTFALPMCGFVIAKLREAAGTFNDTHEDPTKRETSLAKCIKDMKAITADELRKDLGHATFAISPLTDGTAHVLAEFFSPGNYMDTIDKYRKTDKAMDATVALVSTYTFLLSRYAWPEDLELAIEAALAKASGKPWREAADSLFHDARELIAKFGEDEDDQESDDDGGGE